MTTKLFELPCSSTSTRAIRKAKELPARLQEIHGGRIVLRDTAVYNGSNQKIDVACTVCGRQWEARVNALISSKNGCSDCVAQKNKDGAGKIRNRRASNEEKEYARFLHKEKRWTYTDIGRFIGRHKKQIQLWCDPEQLKRSRKYQAKYYAENIESCRAASLRYKKFEHGRAGDNAHNATRRLHKQNTPEFVFLDNEWQEVDRKATWKLFDELLLPSTERKAIQELYLECQHLTETTGVEHHVDHIQPLSKGGEHLMINLQIIPASENLSKNNTYRVEDQQLIAQKLF